MNHILAIFSLLSFGAFAGDRVEMVSPSTGVAWRSFLNTTVTPTVIGRHNFVLTNPSNGSVTATTVVNVKIETCAGGATCTPVKLGSSGILRAYISSPSGAQISPEIILPFSYNTTVPYRITQEIPLTVTVHGRLAGSIAGTYSLTTTLMSSGSASDTPFQYKLNYATIHLVNE